MEVLGEPRQTRLPKSYRCWACLWWAWTGTVRTWRSHACIFSCSSSLLHEGMLGKVSTKKKRKTLVSGFKKKKEKEEEKSRNGFLLLQSLATGQESFSLLHSSSGCVSVALVSVCGGSDDHEWLESGDGGGGGEGGGSTCKCICIPARLLRGSRARLSDQRGRGDVVCSLIFAYRTFHLLLSEGRWRGFSPVPSSSNTPSPPLWTFPPTPLSIHSEHTRFHSSSFWVTTVGVTIQWLSSGSLPLRLSLRNKHTLPHTHS